MCLREGRPRGKLIYEHPFSIGQLMVNYKRVCSIRGCSETNAKSQAPNLLASNVLCNIVGWRWEEAFVSKLVSISRPPLILRIFPLRRTITTLPYLARGPTSSTFATVPGPWIAFSPLGASRVQVQKGEDNNDSNVITYELPPTLLAERSSI